MSCFGSKARNWAARRDVGYLGEMDGGGLEHGACGPIVVPRVLGNVGRRLFAPGTPFARKSYTWGKKRSGCRSLALTVVVSRCGERKIVSTTTACPPPLTSLHHDPTPDHSRHCHEPFLPVCHPCLPCPAPRRHRWAERCVPADCMHAAQHSAAQSIYLLPRRRAGRVGLGIPAAQFVRCR